jgi:hypothetical protein
MKKLSWLSSVLFVLALTTSSFGVAVDILVGDFESPAVGGRYDGWWEDGLTLVNATTPATAITRGTHCLKGTTTVGGWGPGWQFNFSSLVDGYDTALAPEACLVVDYTGFASDFAGGWGDLGTSLNSAAPVGGWDKSGFKPMVLDGLSHRMIFTLTPAYKTAIQGAKDALSWGANLGLCLNTAAGNATLYIDNVWLMPAPPQDQLKPHDPVVDQVATSTNETVTFHWKAAADPNTVRKLAVNPDIVDQYVFVSAAGGADLFYLGKTNADPGLEPNSLYGPATLSLNSVYKWAVVEVMAGHTQTLTVGANIATVDPNNQIGPTWTLKTSSSIPTISAQPVNSRAPVGTVGFSAFTVGVASLSTPTYQWYNSADDVIDAGDFALASASATTNTLILGAAPSSISTSHQKYYYCRISNIATVSGGGTEPDVYTNVVSFVAERMVAQYKFENNLNDAVTLDPHNGTGVGSPIFSSTDKVEGGYALSLNGTNQYVTLATTTPSPALSRTITGGATTSAAYPKPILAGGIGGGLDIGTIQCWVKATQAGAILSNADPNGRASMQIEGNGYGAIVVRGGTTQVGYQFTQSAPYTNLIGDGKWHLVTATWNKNGAMNMYVDTTRVQANATNASFVPWMYSVLIGAARGNTENYAEVNSFFGGLLDNLRVYNYMVSTEAIAQEYFNVTGTRTCINAAFTGSVANLDNTGASFCKIDLADFAVMAQSWLTAGFYPL